MKLLALLFCFAANLAATAQVTALAAVMKDNKWGYIDTKGNWVIPPKFDGAQPFSEGLAPANIGWTGGNDQSKLSPGKWGYIDATGNWVIEPQFTDISNFSEGLAFVNVGASMVAWEVATVTGGQWGLIDKAGKWVMQPTDSIQYYPFSEGLARFRRMDKNTFGFIDKKGKVVIDGQLDATDFNNGYSVVLNEIYMDKKGKHVKSFEMAYPFSCGLACVKEDEKFWMIDDKLEKVLELSGPCEASDSLILSYGGSSDQFLIGYLDRKGNWVIKPQYVSATNFQDGMAIVQESGAEPYLCIDKKGNILYSLPYPGSTNPVHFKGFYKGLLLQNTTDRYPFTFIDKTGKPLTREGFSGAFHFTSVK